MAVAHQGKRSVLRSHPRRLPTAVQMTCPWAWGRTGDQPTKPRPPLANFSAEQEEIMPHPSPLEIPGCF